MQMKKLAQHRMPTIYDGFEFPPVPYAEYPKQVRSPSDGKDIIVYNSREEREIMDEAPKAFVTSGKTIVEKDEMTLLLEQAEKLGLKPHHKIGLARLRSMVKEAESNFKA
jgi:hypothetical protein